MTDILFELNQYSGGIGGIYHDYAVKVGISGSMLDILYVLNGEDGSCYQSLFYKQTGLSRSTINSCLKKMEKEQLVDIQAGKGRNTIVTLTESGRNLMIKTAGQLVELEKSVLKSWSDEEQDLYLKLSQKFYNGLKERVERLN
ncbi:MULTISPECIES: MarR family winged helix-turn-helix transcriptional regulator [Streptococcus]|uniref:DNA-binding transcriptional regulator, MarR family n=1 Tax=Streptococcus gallolyticus TaxID=315405 RepID=A0A1I7GSP8_9STRE|nr:MULTISPECIES: MarR family winged helix-turn-helix transcriptional regulator [Streptococcus]MCR5052982.1 MarR family winged helix-turn-helix transcriptional regulator [Streptococcus sp.]MCY7184346.1 MarR family winged helix-turn-helix transcriptional regulator [Streptococcus gallolyticus subsp. gallolyticus]MCY7190094.1 MarR family winged helix-turn-helix transcriptional regulator [Streptococcus gallolyticus subsp. gallolyticus]MCY7201818.1 MarR family winged helix-turn-helix transcriptional 